MPPKAAATPRSVKNPRTFKAPRTAKTPSSSKAVNALNSEEQEGLLHLLARGNDSDEDKEAATYSPSMFANTDRMDVDVDVDADDNVEADVDVDSEMSDSAAPTARTPHQMAYLARKAEKAREVALVNKVATVTGVIQNRLESDAGVVVKCYHHAPDKSAQMDKSFDYNHLMKLVSSVPFVLVKQTMLQEGPYAGHVAIIIKQSVPFPFMKLPAKVRMMIYEKVVKHDQEDKEPITMTCRQSGRKTAYASNYKENNKLALLSVCKQICTEAAPLVYAQKFQFPGTQVVSMFLSQIGQFRRFLKHIRSDTYNSATARTSFQLLQDARGLKKVHFAHVSSNEGPQTAIKNIFNDAHAFLLAIDRKDPLKGLKVLQFAKTAFHRRDKSGAEINVIKWDEGEWEQFWEGMMVKLKRAAAH